MYNIEWNNSIDEIYTLFKIFFFRNNTNVISFNLFYRSLLYKVNDLINNNKRG